MSPDDSPSAPSACGIAFKEWAGVCEALAEGRQSLILRKGGIAEQAGGFVPEHGRFWLFPTHVHELEQGLRVPRNAGRSPVSAGGASAGPGTEVETVAIQTLVETGPIWWVDQLDHLLELEEFHVWTEATVEKRFHYRKPGLWVLGVRVYQRDEPWILPVTPALAGCKTWVPIDPPLELSGVSPVLDDQEYHKIMDRIRLTMNADR